MHLSREFFQLEPGGKGGREMLYGVCRCCGGGTDYFDAQNKSAAKYKYTSTAESQLTNIPASEPGICLEKHSRILEEFLAMLDKELFLILQTRKPKETTRH